jgi:hypothetical protein
MLETFHGGALLVFQEMQVSGFSTRTPERGSATGVFYPKRVRLLKP